MRLSSRVSIDYLKLTKPEQHPKGTLAQRLIGMFNSIHCSVPYDDQKPTTIMVDVKRDQVKMSREYHRAIEKNISNMV